ncbi:predicted GPI-anchored protein 58 [Triticum aestivum]|uniref:predicted GPI-anchored protein 58 n=1 Tax=Triticum aestivum TaxID=4565 RepID=UPI001D0048DD|nr:predicted GPI-anchored protein 58 [Triticum aestivum]
MCASLHELLDLAASSSSSCTLSAPPAPRRPRRSCVNPATPKSSPSWSELSLEVPSQSSSTAAAPPPCPLVAGSRLRPRPQKPATALPRPSYFARAPMERASRASSCGSTSSFPAPDPAAPASHRASPPWIRSSPRRPCRQVHATASASSSSSRSSA